MPERNGKGQGEDSPNQSADSLAMVDQPQANLYPPDILVCRCHVVVLLCFLLSLKPRPFVQSFCVLRYACAPTTTDRLTVHVLFFPLGRCPFFRVFFCIALLYRFLIVSYEDNVVRFPLRAGVFLPCYHGLVFFYLVTTGWIFYISSYETSIKQSRNRCIYTSSQA